MINHTTRYIASTNLGMFKSTYPSKTASLQPYKKHNLYDIYEEQEEEDEEDYNDYATTSHQHCIASKRYSTSSSYSISDHLETIYEVEEEQQQQQQE